MTLRPVRIGIIGTGFGRSAQVPGFRACEGAEVVALCGSRRDRTEALARELGVPLALTDYRKLLARDDVDLVSVVTPPYLHHSMTLAALAAGKHVLCEKPMAMDVGQAREMLERAEAAGRLHLIDHELRFNPTRGRLKELLDGGFLGRVHHAAIQISTDFRADPVARTWDWWSERDRGGGSLGATASHQIDLLRWWLGDFRAVAGDLGTAVARRKAADSDAFREVTSDDHCALFAELESGAKAYLFITSVARHPLGTRTEIHGEKGTLLLDADDRLWGRRAGESSPSEYTVPDPLRELAGIEKNVWAVSFVSLARHLVECIRAQKPLERGATFEDGLRCQAVLDSIRKSAAERRWVGVPPG
jgi:predicted dehydrogenase